MKTVVEKSKNQVVLFWGNSDKFNTHHGWPSKADLVCVADELKKNAKEFLKSLMLAEKGFYFLEAKDDKDLSLTRGMDFRNSSSKGICLVLTEPFSTESDYIQAAGRCRRGNDEGNLMTL